MNKIKAIATATAFVAMTATVNAKEWKSEVVTVNGGNVQIVETVKSCNYARTIKLAREAAEKHEGAYFNLTSADNLTDCPKKSRKAKDEAAN